MELWTLSILVTGSLEARFNFYGALIGSHQLSSPTQDILSKKYQVQSFQINPNLAGFHRQGDLPKTQVLNLASADTQCSIKVSTASRSTLLNVLFSPCKPRYIGLDLGVSQFLAILRAGSFPVGDKVVCAHQTITLNTNQTKKVNPCKTKSFSRSFYPNSQLMVWYASPFFFCKDNPSL